MLPPSTNDRPAPPAPPAGLRRPLLRSASRLAALRGVTMALLLVPTLACAQAASGFRADATGEVTRASEERAAVSFTSLKDSLEYVAARARAEADTGYRVVVSLFDRRVFVLSGDDTLRVAPAAVAMNRSLDYEGRSWTFVTPRGPRRVLGKAANPIWTPPDWHYAEIAQKHNLKLRRLDAKRPVRLSDGGQLVVRNGYVGVVYRGQKFAPLPTDEEIVFDGQLFIPPFGTKNRRIEGELGRYKLDLGDGYLLHGTPREETIGSAATHGCVRLKEEDIGWMYANVPVGTRVYIF